MPDNFIKFENVEIKRGEDFSLKIPLLEFGKGGIYCFVGPNGTGKTTFFNSLALLEPVHKGRITIEGNDAAGPGAASLRQRIGYMMDNPYMFRGTVLWNVSLGLKFRKVPSAEIKSKARKCLKKVGMESFASRSALRLSKGETKRVALARALAYSPDIIVLDEPLAHIDRHNCAVIEEIIRKENEERGATVFFSTHIMEEGQRLASAVYSFMDGTVTGHSIENLFRGTAEQKNGLCVVDLGNGVTITAVSEVTGPARVSLPPEAVILSLKPFESSALNVLKGVIIKADMSGAAVRVHLDAGIPLIALITEKSYHDLGLNIGREIYAAFKSTSVKVY